MTRRRARVASAPSGGGHRAGPGGGSCPCRARLAPGTGGRPRAAWRVSRATARDPGAVSRPRGSGRSRPRWACAPQGGPRAPRRPGGGRGRRGSGRPRGGDPGAWEVAPGRRAQRVCASEADDAARGHGWRAAQRAPPRPVGAGHRGAGPPACGERGGRVARSRRGWRSEQGPDPGQREGVRAHGGQRARPRGRAPRPRHPGRHGRGQRP
jgi:hypothetical protein